MFKVKYCKLHFILSVNFPAHIVVRATLNEITLMRARRFLSKRLSNHAVSSCVCVSTFICWLNASRLFSSMYMFWTHDSIFFVSISWEMSKVWILLSRNDSITFHRSIKCTDKKVWLINMRIFTNICGWT